MEFRRVLGSLVLLVLFVGVYGAVGLTYAYEPAGSLSSLEGIDEDILAREKEKQAVVPLVAPNPPGTPGIPLGVVAILEEDFETWPPAAWTIVNNGGDCVWESTTVVGRPNYAGGDGQAAIADSDWCGPDDKTMDTELWTPAMDLAVHGGGTLSFVAAYNWWSGDEYFAVDVSSDGGSSWTNLLHWEGDQDPYGPGELVRIDLGPYAASEVVVRFHYYAPAWQFYVEVDQVRVLPPLPDLSGSHKAARGLAAPGDPITYTIVVSNAGSRAAEGTSVVDPIPLGTTFAYTVAPPALVYNSSENRIEWAGTVPTSEEAALTFVVTVSENLGCGSAITNTAVITQPEIPTPIALQQVTQIWDRIHYVEDLEADAGGFTPGGVAPSWAWGVPTSGPRSAHTGTRVWATNLEGNYNGSEDSYLTSPVIDLSDAPGVSGYEVWLQWWDWFRSERCCDYGVVEARGGDTDWTPVSTQFRDYLGGWTEHSVDISAFAGVSDFQFRFHFHSDATVTFEGWYVDDIAIVQCAPPPGLYLWPDGVAIQGCVGVSQTHTFGLFNATGGDGTFDLSYDLSDPALGSMAGPDGLWLGDQTGASLVVTLTPELCLPGGLELVAALEASGNGYGDSSQITKTIVTGGSCPTCLEIGWLEGHVYDYPGVDPPCTQATVWVEPGGMEVTLDESGYYTAPLVPFDYEVTGWASGYPEPAGPYPVSVAEGVVSVQNLSLDRPEPDIAPQVLVAEATVQHTATQVLTLTNQGTYTLVYEITEAVPALADDRGLGSGDGMAEFRSRAEPAAIEVEPQLLNQLNADGETGYLVYFRDRPDLSPALEMDWIERGRFVVTALQKAADRSQARVRAYLDEQGADYQAFWIDNVIAVNHSSQPMFQGLMTFPEIEALRARRHPILHEPVAQMPASPDLLGIEPNIGHVGADRVWTELGVTGEGIIVASIDTGVRYTHGALVRQYRGNFGGGSFDHNHNWWDPALGGSDPAPNDWHNHGSHTMGIMLGDDGAGNQIGMAPGAEWIACQGFEEGDAELLECGQFMAAPWDLTGANPDPDLRPHIINNSWGDCLQVADHWYDGVIDAWHALGIYPVFSNGNASNCFYPSPPGCNTVGNPARAGHVTGVGSSGRDNGQYATHSNWGPTDDPDLVNPNGYPSLKPQVLAPGVAIRSAYKGSDTAYGTMTGTSMSAPHVSGLVALMWSAAPCLVGEYAATETIIEQSAVPIPYTSNCGGEGPGNVPNFATGWGEIDAYEAVQGAMDYCRTDWLDWAQTDVVSGDLGSGQEQQVEVVFTCTPTATQQIQPLEGALRVFHNDPCQKPMDVHLTFFCYGPSPTPMWKKSVWINGQEAASISGPHIVSPGDTVLVEDRVGAAFSETVSAVLAETWLDSLRLVDYGWDELAVRTSAEGSSTLLWVLPEMDPNRFYLITKTFEVQDGDWLTTSITESYTVEGALAQWPKVVVGLEKRYRIYLATLLRGP